MATVGHGVKNHIYQGIVDHFLDSDKLYDVEEEHDLRPEFVLLDKTNFKVQEGTSDPEITFSSAQGPNDLPLLVPDAPLMYQKMMLDLEPWTIYRALPQLLKYDRAMSEFFKNLRTGQHVCPTFEKERNRPSLWTYYETLPDWCRNHPLVRQTLFAMEYHKPRLDIREKEVALNFMASFLRPIDGRLREVISEVARSNRIRVTVENGKVMMNELNFYTIDVADLGSDTEEDGDDTNMEKELSKMLMGGVDEDEAAAQASLADQALMRMQNLDRDKDRREIYDREGSVSQYELDPEVQQCLVDFP